MRMRSEITIDHAGRRIYKGQVPVETAFLRYLCFLLFIFHRGRRARTMRI